MDIIQLYLRRNAKSIFKSANLFKEPVPGSSENIFQDVIQQPAYTSPVKSDYVPLNIEKMLGLPDVDRKQFSYKWIDPLDTAGGLSSVFDVKLTAPPPITEEAIRASERGQQSQVDVGVELDKILGVNQPQGDRPPGGQHPQAVQQQVQQPQVAQQQAQQPNQPENQQPVQPKGQLPAGPQPGGNQLPAQPPQLVGLNPQKLQEFMQALQQGDAQKAMEMLKDFAAGNPALVAGIINQFLPWENNPLSIFMALGLAALSHGEETFQTFLNVLGIAFGANQEQGQKQNPNPEKK